MLDKLVNTSFTLLVVISVFTLGYLASISYQGSPELTMQEWFNLTVLTGVFCTLIAGEC